MLFRSGGPQGARLMPPTWTPFGLRVQAALDAARETQAAGPRSMADLARATGIAAPTLVQALSGKRALGAHIRAAICAALPGMEDGT